MSDRLRRIGAAEIEARLARRNDEVAAREVTRADRMALLIRDLKLIESSARAIREGLEEDPSIRQETPSSSTKEKISMHLFIMAAKQKFRFASERGLLATEALFDLQLTSKNGFNLDAVAREVNRELKAQSEESFVEASNNPLKAELEAKLEVVKTVIAIKQAEQDLARVKAMNAEQRRKILDALEAARNQKLSQASEEELLQQLAALPA